MDCDFQYFFNKSSLIYTETNNYVELGSTQTYDDESKSWSEDVEQIPNKFLAYLGEDRGARIYMANTTVKHSNFCKGMIVFNKQRTIQYDDEPRFVNFTAQLDRNDSLKMDDGRNISKIVIIDSHFENLAWQ